MRRPDSADGMLVAANVIWSLNYATTKYAFERWSPIAFSGLRFATAGIALALLVRLREGGLGVERRDVRLIVMCGFVGIFLNQLTFTYAVDYTAAANVALILASAPAFAAVFAVMLGHERVRPAHWMALGVSLIGVALVVLGGSNLAGFSLRGDLLAVGAALTWAAYTVMLRPLFGRYSASRISALVILVGAVIMAPVTAVQVANQDFGSLHPPGLGRVGLLDDRAAPRHELALLPLAPPGGRRQGDALHVPPALPGRGVRGVAPGREARGGAADRRRW